MTSENWEKIEEIFQDALDLPAAQRSRFIHEKTNGDEQLRSEIEKLVARFETEEEFLESPVWTDSKILHSAIKKDIAESLEKEIPRREEMPYPGELIGVYRLTGEIGRGGMGVVYTAERADGEFEQKAAVKLIKRGMDTDFIVSRFRHERQILANLNHPNIARLLDGGTTKEGSPYFVMEYIEGKTLLKYCREKNLDLQEKIKLFLQICDAVGYAHRKKIIHRDIKPSNILVTRDGEPKLLDFGIAKILDTESIHESLIPTATAMRLMTPEYASPEQVKGEDVTPANDQYSLGVLFYELLSGSRPYKFPSRAPHEIARVICEVSPSSLVISSLLTESNAAFENKTTKSKGQRTTDDGLSKILLKTLRKNPSERYDSVEDFAADIRRFLNNETIRAESFATIGNSISSSAVQEVSPRWRGIKQGIFITVLALVLIPVCLVLLVGGLIEPLIIISAFLTVFLGGLMRIIYALFFEEGKAKIDFSNAETKIITGQTLAENQTTAEMVKNRPKRLLFSTLKYGLATLVLGSFGYLFYNIASNLTIDFSNTPPEKRWKNVFAATMSVERVTTSGATINSAISPDGSQIAFALREAELQSLWIQPANNSAKPIRLTTPSNENYVGLTFSPDGKYVYYDTYNAVNGVWRLNRVAVGGEPQIVGEDVYRNIGFAPDGRSIAFYRLDKTRQTTSLTIGEISDAGKIESTRTLAEYKLPDHPVGNPAFSPDGKKILYGVTDIEDGAKEITNLFIYDLDAGTNEKFGGQTFNEIAALAWREYEDEIVVSANLKNTEPMQLWLVSYPAGELTRLTNDLNSYSGVSIARDSSALVASKKNVASNISTIDLATPNRDSLMSARLITDGVDRQDGIKGLEWTADGRILYVAGTEKKVNLIDADGANRQTFNLGNAAPSSPVLTSDGKFLFFIDEQGQEATLKRFEPASGAVTQITSGLTLSPALTPDGKFIIYSAINEAQKTSLHRVSIEGGKALELTSASVFSPAVSPDGRLIVCFYNTETMSGSWELALLSSNGGVPLNILRPPDTVNLQNPHERPLGWSPDSHFVYYVNDKGGVSNLFRVTADGSNKTEQITYFKVGRIFNFALEPNGKRAVIAQGSSTSDIVMFSEVRKIKN